MPKFYYDLTELLYQMNAKTPYYGIAKTVMEIGYELAKRHRDVTFVVFSQAHQQFLEATPILDDKSGDRPLRLEFSRRVAPTRLRRSRAHSRSVIRKVGSVLRCRMERAKWRDAPEGSVNPVNLDGQLLVSLSQPRILSDFHFALKQRGESVDLLPLLHDMIPLHFDENQKYKRNFIKDNHYILRNCQSVIANSEFTKSDIQRLCDVGALPPCRDIFTVPLAHEFRIHGGTEGDAPPPAHENYFLTVGITPGRKNLEVILEAILELRAQGRQPPKLILAGAPRKRILKMLDRPPYAELKDHVGFEFNPSPARLAALYEGAHALLLPSLIEGWGLPAAEAVWLKTPVIAADIPVLHEVLGPAGIFFPPQDATALAEVLHRLTEEADYQEEIVAKIAKRYPDLRSWERVTEDLVKAAQAYRTKTTSKGAP